jgi:tetratricopeptide (TPR) repeat protein
VRRVLRPAGLTAAVCVLAAALTLGAAIGLGRPGQRPASSQPPVAAAALSGAGGRTLAGLVTGLQTRLHAEPRDHRGWSTLALAYVEQARITADPTYYPKAEQALARAAAVAPGDDLMLTGQATLAAARHDFARSLALADRALTVNPSSAQAHAVRSDALTELGRYDEARAAATRADRLRPGTSTFARLSYAAELRGDLAGAADLMRRAAQAATAPADYAFAAFHLGELARAAGRRDEAARHFADALRADPDYAPALAGRARLAVGRGDLAAAEKDYRTVVRRLPLPEYVVELGELYEATGRRKDAAQQFAVATAYATLARANGVGTDLETALFQADHGNPAAALAAARAEWARRHSIHVADALAWALHASGRDREALVYADRATGLSTRDPRLLFHRGAIEAALARAAPARAHLAESLALDGGASPWRDARATRLLQSVRGAR